MTDEKVPQRTILVFNESATYYGSHTGRHIGERLAAVIEEIATESEIDARPRVRVTVEVLP